MIVGHFLLAFCVAALIARFLGYDAEYALFAGIFAGSFAALPDIDILFAWKEIMVFFGSGMSEFVDAFWSSSKVVH